jgi:hypothetical protein
MDAFVTEQQLLKGGFIMPRKFKLLGWSKAKVNRMILKISGKINAIRHISLSRIIV